MTLFCAPVRLVIDRLGWIFATGDARDAEILALRHQILVLQRQINRPHFTNTDRTILGLLGSAMTRSRRSKAFLIVKPETVLRWHRRRIARHWTQIPNKPRGRPPPTPNSGGSQSESPTRTRIGDTEESTEPWTTQTTRNLMIQLDAGHRFRYLIRDGAGQFTRSYDNVLAGSGITAIRIPPRSPQANAYAERWVRTLRHELLDRTIIWNETQLQQLLAEYIEHYNTQRPHRGIGQRAPNDHDNVTPIRPNHQIERTTTCAGLINQYQPAA